MHFKGTLNVCTHTNKLSSRTLAQHGVGAHPENMEQNPSISSIANASTHKCVQHVLHLKHSMQEFTTSTAKMDREKPFLDLLKETDEADML